VKDTIKVVEELDPGTPDRATLWIETPQAAARRSSARRWRMPARRIRSRTRPLSGIGVAVRVVLGTTRTSDHDAR
jgi:hypothetical protein